MKQSLIRGDLLHCTANPRNNPDALEALTDHVLLIVDGRIADLGPALDMLSKYPDLHCEQHRDCTLIPGMIDTHVHYPQVDVISSWGTQLLDWLERYTFPAEMRLSDPLVAAETAEFFLDELQRNGTTTALVFGTSDPCSVDAFFEAAQQRDLCMIAGKVLMDRHAPPALCDDTLGGVEDSRKLIDKWHGVDRLHYAITPRFAPTSTPEQLKAAGDLLAEYPDVYMHTHISENIDECKWVDELFAEADGYLDVYARAGLLGPKSVLAHGIHLSDAELETMAEKSCSIAHCPCSNTFIGSGLFPLTRIQEHGVTVGLATDVGGGDSFSLLRNAAEAYKIQQLQGRNLRPAEMLYLATLGGAEALSLEARLGSFTVGKDADVAVLKHDATPLLKRRMQSTDCAEQRWFLQSILGDDRSVKGVYIRGQWRGNDT